jgi:hypothetical protein
MWQGGAAAAHCRLLDVCCASMEKVSQIERISLPNLTRKLGPYWFTSDTAMAQMKKDFQRVLNDDNEFKDAMSYPHVYQSKACIIHRNYL